jgi:mRNA turnover protein 4
MAKSKKNKVVPLTKVGKKNFGDKKVKMVKNIHKYLDQYNYCYAFAYKNMTSIPMSELRNYWSNSTFVIGKNKVMQVALGKNEEEYRVNSHKLSPFLKSNCGLFFSNESPEKIIEYK